MFMDTVHECCSWSLFKKKKDPQKLGRHKLHALRTSIKNLTKDIKNLVSLKYLCEYKNILRSIQNCGIQPIPVFQIKLKFLKSSSFLSNS